MCLNSAINTNLFQGQRTDIRCTIFHSNYSLTTLIKDDCGILTSERNKRTRYNRSIRFNKNVCILFQAEINGPESTRTINIWCVRSGSWHWTSLKTKKPFQSNVNSLDIGSCVFLYLHSSMLCWFISSHLFLRYFHLSTFFWMFLEGKQGCYTNVIKLMFRAIFISSSANSTLTGKL